MKIEFLTKDFEPQPHLLAMTEELFTRAAVNIGLPVSQLSLVLVADDAMPSIEFIPGQVTRIIPAATGAWRRPQCCRN
jgi:hypothetical protein